MTPSPAVPTPAPAAAEANAVAPSAAVAPAEAPALQPPWATSVPEPQLDGSVRDRIIAMIRNDLKFHSPAIEAEFLGAELTRTGLLKAAKKVRGMRPRLISEDRMESIGTRAINIITGREAA